MNILVLGTKYIVTDPFRGCSVLQNHFLAIINLIHLRNGVNLELSLLLEFTGLISEAVVDKNARNPDLVSKECL